MITIHRAMPRFAAFLPLMLGLPLSLAGSRLAAQTPSIDVPDATVLQVQLDKHVPMKRGEALACHLIYPVYVDNKLAIPAGTVVRGHVIGLHSDRSRRIHARLWGDFTPFHIPVVHFDELVLPDGTVKQIATGDATNGAPVLHLSPPAREGAKSFLGQQIAQAKQRAKETVALVTAPGREDRLVQFVYKQLPYHPERIESGTAWTVALTQPLVVTAEEIASSGKIDAEPNAKGTTKQSRKTGKKGRGARSRNAAVKAGSEDTAWHIRAYLKQTISSATEKPGNTFDAVVAEPVFNPDHSLAIPEGSLLEGTILQAKPARSFGRAGKLRFDFRELKLPGEASQHVMGTLTGADSNRAEQLQLDQEGGVQPKPRNRVIVPLVLSLLANRALSDDGSVAGNAAVGSNGFGLVGRVVGIVGGSRALAAGIGFYGAGLSFSERWLVHGQNIAFTKNTRIEVTTVPSRNSLPTPEAEQSTPGKP
jgi:hypothetical protein